MIYIVHGDDYSKSRKVIINQKTKVGTDYINEKDIEEISPKELYEMLVSYDLFGNAPFVVIKIPATKIAGAESYIEVLKKTPDSAVVIILCSKKLGQTNDFLKNAKKLKAKIALNQKEIQSNIFTFVDHVFFKNRNEAYEELKKLEEEDQDPFYIFSMILYGLRIITAAKYNTNEFRSKSDYVKDKALRQAEHFTKDAILDLFESLYQIDKKIKTGQLSTEMFIPYTIEQVIKQ